MFWVYLWNNFVKGSVKILFWQFWPFFGQKYIACGDKIVFSEVFGLFLPIYWCCMVKFCYMNIIYCLLMKKKNLKFWHQNFWPVLDPFLVKNDHFCAQIRFLTIYLVTVHQNFMYVVHRVVANVGCRGGPSLGVLVLFKFLNG